MDPTLIAGAVKAGFEFGTELLKYLQTPEGQAFARKTLEDRAAWDRFWQDAARGVRSLFDGSLMSRGL